MTIERTEAEIQNKFALMVTKTQTAESDTDKIQYTTAAEALAWVLGKEEEVLEE